ncbi:MAG: nicotinate-nucleotide adenylyltransferase [Coriobacteriia bacterium]|nr:nicotinate-nucleotide adenylyltransferase [Coriobacteriia bacterium]
MVINGEEQAGAVVVGAASESAASAAGASGAVASAAGAVIDQAKFGRFSEAIAASEGDRPFRLGLFGGTFDPVHIGHLLLAQFALEQHQLDGVLFVPCSYPFYKLIQNAATGQKGPASADQRVQMLQLAVQDSAQFAVSRVEVDREGPSYTVDTVRILRDACQLPDGSNRVQLFMILGADAMIDLPNWREAKTVIDAVTVLFAERPGSERDALLRVAQAESIDALPVEAVQLDVSSTAIRARVASALPINHLTPESVVSYIDEHGLYRG